jgi:hypothetical protein
VALLCVSTQLPSQLVLPVGHEHMPVVQLCPTPHDIPHAPQLAGAVEVSTQTPLQLACPAWQPPQTPAEQLAPSAHALPQAPQ